METPQATPAPIQVVFQGGGAKLCLLMAVAEVLQEYQSAGRIEIRRVAGSSAGAIAAVMLVSGKPIKTYKAELKNLATKYLKATRTSSWLGAWRVFNGSAYFKELYLEKFFEELFCSATGDPIIISQLKNKGTKIYYTDLYSLASRSAPEDEAIPKALARSCKFPFAFSGFGSGDAEVDGGLALNFPVDDLKADESTLGSVIGISFASRFGDSRKSDLISYTQQLFSAAIQSGVTRSELILGKSNVYAIDTTIGTFEFDRALKEGLGIEYELTSNKFDTWLATWLKTSGPIQPVRSGTENRLLRPSLSDTLWSRAIVHEINDRLKLEPSTKATTIGCYETAVLDDSGEFTGKYIAKTIKTFCLVRPTNILQFDFQIGNGGSFAMANLGCAAFDSQGEALSFVPHVEELTKPDDILRSFRVYFLFDRPMAPDSLNQPFRVEYQYEGDNPYPNLGRTTESAIFSLRQGGADEGVLCVAFPRAVLGPHSPKVTDIARATHKQLDDVQYEADDEIVTPSDQLPLMDFVHIMGLRHAPERYWLVGRRIRDIGQLGAFGFVIEKGHPEDYR